MPVVYSIHDPDAYENTNTNLQTPMPPIRKLDPALVNKIAAGEVIERPASVAKELMENAVDAGATRIDVTLEEGGIRLIRVTDNGHGIAREELPLAVAAHATSKIANTDDLFRIRTLGFRGEALASIAAVSHLRVCSRRAGQIEAHELIASGAANPKQRDAETDGARLSPCAAPVGTTVEVRNLFHNVPARRKFLRRPPTELTHATGQLARQALAHPGIAFSLTHNGRQARNLPATGDRRTRIADFYGAELAQCLLAVDRAERGVRIEALIAPPAQSRASTKWQYLFLNGRSISDRRIGFAIREAFRGLIEHDRCPVVFIFLTVEPDAFDVNVHPTKIEVRWRDAGLIQSQVLAVLRETLLGHDLTPSLRPPDSGVGPAPAGETVHERRTRQAVVDYLKSVDPTQARIDFQPPRFSGPGVRPSIASTYLEPASGPAAPEAVDDRRQSHDNTTAPSATERPAASQPIPQADARQGPHDDVPTGSVLQIHNTYLVAQTPDGIVIIDQHALHERILYESFRRRVLSGPLESQRLLIPETLELSQPQALAAEQHRELLARIGIELGAFGPQAAAVQSFPVLLSNVDIRAFVSDLLDKLAESGDATSEESFIHQALDMMACKAAIKAGDSLSAEEMHALLAQRHLTERSSNCPHGRPTTLQLTTRDLEKQFKRI